MTAVEDGSTTRDPRRAYRWAGGARQRDSQTLVDGEFTAKERDSGLEHLGARFMSSARGRFTSADLPFADWDPSDPQSRNLFAYVKQSVEFVDPTGRACAVRPGGKDGDDKCGFSPKRSLILL